MYLQSIKFFTLSILLSLTSLSSLKAQSDSIIIRPIQISFVTPIGTNGKLSDQTVNNFSYNVLFGSSAGVSGLELGGLVNKTNGSIIGAQFAGLGNLGKGNLKGAQISGLINTVAYFRGLQAAGIINISADTVATTDGSSVAPTNGGQISGVININRSSIEGLQAAGVVNLNADSLKGAQIAGLINKSNHVQGVQISGLLNKTKTLSGVQFGIINIADTIQKGVQVGLINIVKNGYKAIELESNESFYGNINFKMGSQRLYTIFSVAYKEQNGANIWAPGFGLGTYISLSQKAGLNIDAINYQVNEDEWWTSELNQLNKLKINGSYQFMNHLTLYGGVSLNVMVTKIKTSEENPGGRLFETPNSFYDETHGSTRVIIYPGINVGIRF